MSLDLSLLEKLKARGVDFCHRYSGGNLLHHFFKSLSLTVEGIREDLFDLLIEQGCDVNGKDDKNRTPLHFAAWRAELKLVKRLIELGANANSREFICGYTALHAVEYNHEKMVVMLLDKGANVTAKLIRVGRYFLCCAMALRCH